jgi:LacI family repressor for deo operon, udp, cdd, tsx, nupC, and nupG
VTASRVGALYLPTLQEMQVPIDLINNQHPGEFGEHVSFDNPAGARAVTTHLLELGHRRIGYVGDRLGLHSNEERFAGYRDTLESAGIAFDPALVVYGESTPESGCQAMQELLGRSDPPTAVFCYNDMSAYGAMRAARDSGLRVPTDISIAGFDDLFLSSYTDPPLTTLRQPKHEMGSDAAALLLDLLSGGSPKSIIKPGTLVPRQSTAARRA